MSLLSHQRSFVYDDMQELMKKRDTLGSDEGLVEGDMPEEYLMEDFDYLVTINLNYNWAVDYPEGVLGGTNTPFFQHNIDIKVQ